jgi:hypothetical protein
MKIRDEKRRRRRIDHRKTQEKRTVTLEEKSEIKRETWTEIPDFGREDDTKDTVEGVRIKGQ